MALLRYGYATLAQTIDKVALMPVSEDKKRDLRARIRHWAKMLQDRGFKLPDTP
jgi:hypothetical protein